MSGVDGERASGSCQVSGKQPFRPRHKRRGAAWCHWEAAGDQQPIPARSRNLPRSRVPKAVEDMRESSRHEGAAEEHHRGARNLLQRDNVGRATANGVDLAVDQPPSIQVPREKSQQATAQRSASRSQYS